MIDLAKFHQWIEKHAGNRISYASNAYDKHDEKLAAQLLDCSVRLDREEGKLRDRERDGDKLCDEEVDRLDYLRGIHDSGMRKRMEDAYFECAYQLKLPETAHELNALLVRLAEEKRDMPTSSGAECDELQLVLRAIEYVEYRVAEKLDELEDDSGDDSDDEDDDDKEPCEWCKHEDCEDCGEAADGTMVAVCAKGYQCESSEPRPHVAHRRCLPEHLDAACGWDTCNCDSGSGVPFCSDALSSCGRTLRAFIRKGGDEAKQAIKTCRYCVDSICLYCGIHTSDAMVGHRSAVVDHDGGASHMVHVACADKYDAWYSDAELDQRGNPVEAEAPDECPCCVNDVCEYCGGKAVIGNQLLACCTKHYPQLHPDGDEEHRVHEECAEDHRNSRLDGVEPCQCGLILTQTSGDKPQQQEAEMAREAKRSAEVDSKYHGIDMTAKNVDVERTGTKIVLPENMSYAEGIEWMKRKQQEEETVVNPLAQFGDAYFLDAMAAFNRALTSIYGWVAGVPTPGFFGDTPPRMITIETGPNETLQVPWGTLCVPGMGDGQLTTGLNGEAFIISGQFRQKYKAQFDRIVSETKRELRERSIYKAHAIRLDFGYKRNDDDFDPFECAPKFLDLKDVSEADLIFSDDVRNAIELGLFVPIERADSCRRYGIPLKRGILLEGPYGTGKTLTALVTAIKAQRAGWTFMYLNSVLDLEEGLKWAKRYAPCVVFVEDIDRALKDRTIESNAILNQLDGLDTKNSETIVVFTTNFVEQLDKALMRPGRLDTLVSVRAPDDKAAARLVEHYGRDLFEPGMDYAEVGKRLAGRIPAVIREVVERAKLAAVGRLPGANGHGIEGHVREEDVFAAAAAMEHHIALLADKRDEKPRELVLRITNQEQGVKVTGKLHGSTPEYAEFAN